MRSRRAGVDDLWTKQVRDPDGTIRTVRSARDGRGMRWRARYVDDDGHEHTQAFARRSDAQAWLDNDITPALATGTYVTPEAGAVTVAAVYAAWSAAQGHISAKTALTRRSAWNKHVGPHWGDTAVVEVKTSAVRMWVAQLIAAEVGVATIENAFGLLRQVLGAAVEDRRIPRNPCEGVRLPKRRTLTVATCRMLRWRRWPPRSSATPRWSGSWPTPGCGGARWRRCGCVTSTCCAAG